MTFNIVSTAHHLQLSVHRTVPTVRDTIQSPVIMECYCKVSNCVAWCHYDNDNRL